MIRFAGKSLGIAVAVLVLIGISADQVVVRGQTGFFDNSSDVPPSPAPVNSAAGRGSINVGSPAPTVTTPQSSSSAAYQLTPLPRALPGRSRSNSPATTQSAPAKQTTAATSPNTGASPSGFTPQPAKVGPYGVGGRVTPKSANDQARRVMPASNVATNGTSERATQAHYDETMDPGFPPSVPPPSNETPAHPLLFPKAKPLPLPAPGVVFPTDRGQPPSILGSHLGLLPGETATERSLRLMNAIGELERQLDSFGQRNAELNQTVKQRDEQLLLAIREIRAARKEVSNARDELEHLRLQVKTLQDKVRDAERDNAALLQTMAPLLQKLLDPAEANSPADESRE